jgi:uncharacterized Zn finger protein (UPF0148 family)
MIRAELAPVPHHCPRCHGPLFKGYTDEYDCLLCGETIFPQARLVVERFADVQDGPRRRGRPRKHPLVA